jgi:3'(2'), 5'-bisphosphate nucleotidase
LVMLNHFVECAIPANPEPDVSASMTHAQLLEALVPVIRSAGEVVMTVYASDFSVQNKGDASPVTQADQLAELLITDALNRLTPEIPVVGEEAVSDGFVPQVGQRFWLVDPLDGTKEFISRNGEFTVNIALIDQGQAVLGLVLAPALGRLYGGALGLGSWVEEGGVRRAIQCRAVPPKGLTVVASRSHGDAAALDAFLAGRLVDQLVSAGSSLKLCLVASGDADVYPRLGRTMEWDIAAGHAVLASAGGRVDSLAGGALGYGKPLFENPHFAAWGLADGAV